MRQPAVTIIIVHFQGLEILHKCLESLFNAYYKNFNVVLVDNGSKDGSVDSAQSAYGDRLHVIKSKANLGFVCGSNLALRGSTSKYVVLLNDDTIVKPDWLNYIVDVAESNPSIGACQPKLLSLADPKYFEYNGCAGGMLDVYGVPLCRGRVFDVIEEDKGQYDSSAEVFWAGGAAIFIRKSVLDKAGLLDETFYAHMEEIDLCWRIKLLGYKIVAVPKSIVYHVGGNTPLPDKLYLKQRNNLMVLLKNYSLQSLIRFFSIRLALDVFAFGYFALKGERDRPISVLKAYASLLARLKQIIEGRYYVQQRRVVTDKAICEAMIRKSVAIQHYLLRRKFFTQLGQ